ncbi:COG4648 family protein [Marinobacterium lutimaris]|uniref:Uncharacterized membrane protein n=1 Tax=Marinobacterium lutimaris TaxID=568106 RepID=A0A1H5TB54_9GAMM|nr:hypothetical protein [Marinobacterium lutimaris]SEF59994.1 Uncharacterized membrane protein [Marinobacterium lutimaris]
MGKVLLVLLSVLYPALVYFLIDRVQPGWFLSLMFGLLLWRAIASRQPAERWTLVAATLLLAVLSLILPAEQSMKLYPVLMSLAMLLLFGSSLIKGPTLVERIARLKEPDLPPEGVRYTRQVTRVWTVFFAANATIAMATVLSNDDQLWALYNGLISYLLVGMLMLGELLVRRWVREKQG